MENTKKVCHMCIGEEYVKSYIKKHGKRGSGCSYCHKFRKSVPYGDVADMLHEVFENYYRPVVESDNYWEASEGEGVHDVIYNELEINDEDLMLDIYEYLQNEHNPYYPDDYERYNDEFNYVSINYGSEMLDVAWNKMLNSLKSEARYFNSAVKEFLDELFYDIDTFRVKGSESPIKLIDEKTTFFRARVFESFEDVEIALKNPERQFGPPPSEIARSGRMNAQGIPVFYGAASAEVAMAEVRPAVGSYVVVAPFETMRKLRVLDISAMDLIIHEKRSKFSKETIKRLEKSSFLRTFSKRLTIPVLGKNTENEYLITQAVAEYLSINENLNLDGITFNSTQVGKKNKKVSDIYNVVLFRKSSAVADADNKRCEYKVEMHELIEDDLYQFKPSIRKVERKSKKSLNIVHAIPFSAYKNEYVLKLKSDAISFYNIEGVVFEVKKTGIALGQPVYVEKDADDEWGLEF